MRKVADVQLSGNGYRKNNKVLDGARALFESGSLADFLKYSGDYDEIASKVLDLGGKIIYGPQNQGSLNKNATNVHKRFRGLMNEVESAATPSLSLADLKTVRDWKMVRNRVRQNWLLVDSNTDEAVCQTTTAAFSALPDWETSMSTLDALHGVGPATASFILALRDSTIPVFSEELARCCGVVSTSAKYDRNEYREFHRVVNEKATSLSTKSLQITPRQIEQACWACVYSQHPKLTSSSPFPSDDLPVDPPVKKRARTKR
ncbi:hypothetical protein TrST_g6661 [Triparma strigata]|uniref:Uncharacterized protein n=1 Tax=Triparma strigata TaxID=1606541 RepID=A0A9W7BMA4_9STRA|nr:hypothetical protein TrST_g6661 [Triparma strigata]